MAGKTPRWRHVDRIMGSLIRANALVILLALEINIIFAADVFGLCSSGL
jgi:hypothetical protein